MADLKDLSPQAQSAAMRGGMDGWGQLGSTTRHVRYAEPSAPSARRRCHCGCKRRAAFKGMANGVCLVSACEMAIRRWVKTGSTLGSHP